MPKRLQLSLVIVLSFLFTAMSTHARQPKALFCLTREPKSVRSFFDDADKIDVLVPNWYSIDASGLLSGGPNPMVLESARQHHVPILPLVVNVGFAQADVHKLLLNTPIRQHMFNDMIRSCRGNHYTGFQLDFESVNWTDRDILSDFVHPSAEYISIDDALDLAKAYKGHLEWDTVDRSAWLYFYRDDVLELDLLHRLTPFRQRYALVKDRLLYGFASWVLGTEDPEIWDLLPGHT